MLKTNNGGPVYGKNTARGRYFYHRHPSPPFFEHTFLNLFSCVTFLVKRSLFKNLDFMPLTKATADHKSPAQIIDELVGKEIAAADF